jgi:hypothetical protein
MIANPTQPIPSLPSYILSHLEPVIETNANVPANVTLTEFTFPRLSQYSQLALLPPELVEQITSYLDIESVFALRATCLHIANSICLQQHFWYKRLMKNEVFGFFFPTPRTQDITMELRNKSITLRLLPPYMDWMKLIKQLSQYSSFTEAGVFHDAPPGFKNRRRIWKILEQIEEIEAQSSTL